MFNLVFFEKLFTSLPDASLLIDAKGETFLANDAAYKLLKVNKSEEIKLFSFIQGCSCAGLQYELHALKRDGQKNFFSSVVIINKERKELDFLISALSSGEKLFFLITLKPSQASMHKEIQEANTKLFRAKRYIKDILNFQDNIIFATNGRRILEANKQFLEFFRIHSLKELRIKQDEVASLLVDEEGYLTNKKNVPWLMKLRELAKNDHKVKMYDKKSHTYKIFLVKIGTYRKSRGYFIVSLTDITLLESENKQYKELAVYDSLTNIYNRYKLEKILDEKFSQTCLDSIELSMIMFDIDYFKEINDVYGHQKGDEILIQLADLVKENIRQKDHFFRWGGEEFVLLVSSLEKNLVYDLSKRVRKLIKEYDFGLEERRVTCSFGIATFKQGDTKNTLLKRADDALYVAKNSGRNRIEVMA